MLVDIERDGFKYKVQVPDDAPEYLWYAGVIVGPPSLDGLGELDEETKRRLNNELFVRGLITEKDVRKRANEIQAALQSAFRVDVATILEAYSRGRHS